MFGRRRKAEMNSSRLGMLCKLIKQRTDNSILHCKNKRENMFWSRKIMYPGIDRNWRVV